MKRKSEDDLTRYGLAARRDKVPYMECGAKCDPIMHPDQVRHYATDHESNPTLSTMLRLQRAHYLVSGHKRTLDYLFGDPAFAKSAESKRKGAA